MNLSTSIIQIIDQDPISLDVGGKVSEALEILSRGRFHHLPIVDGRKLVGMLTAQDVVGLSSAVRGNIEGLSLGFIDENYSLADLMVADPIVLSDRATVGEAASKLSAGGFHCLPIVDSEYALVGVVTTTDLVAFILGSGTREQKTAVGGERQQALESVLEAAQNFLHSGHDEIELLHLEAAVDAARSASSR